MQNPLVRDFGFKGLTTAAQYVLAGCYTPSDPIDPYVGDIIQEWKMPQSVKDLGPQSMEISVQNYQKFWKKAKENTSCYPDNLSFSTMKAGASSPLIAEIECRLTNIPLKSGYAPDRWKKCLDVMILKKSGNTLLNALRTIVLFPVDCNYAFKHIGREMMRLGEQSTSLAPEQYGSRNQHRAIDLAVNKVLTNDLLRQLKRPGAICCNDAKSCYDLIGHTQASISMQRLGVPKHAINCLFDTLQNATHQVRTAYGDSDFTYGGETWDKPMHGVGQGNGAGPAIWAVVSTPILNMLRSKGLGCKFISPFSSKVTKFVGYSFVDDTDLIVSMCDKYSSRQAMIDLQTSLDTWEGGLKATGGALVPEKTYWYLIDFTWTAGQWSYKTISDSPGSIFANDLQGCRKEIDRIEPSQARRVYNGSKKIVVVLAEGFQRW
jgi:hypothetical protein